MIDQADRLCPVTQLFKKVITQDRFGDHVQEVSTEPDVPCKRRRQQPLMPTCSARIAPAQVTNCSHAFVSTPLTCWDAGLPTRSGLRMHSSAFCVARAHKAEVFHQVRFKEPVCVTGIKVGAPPGATGLPQLKGDARPAVRVFAREAGSLPAARLACLCEPCLLPTTGTQAVRFEVSTGHAAGAHTLSSCMLSSAGRCDPSDRPLQACDLRGACALGNLC